MCIAPERLSRQAALLRVAADLSFVGTGWREMRADGSVRRDGQAAGRRCGVARGDGGRGRDRPPDRDDAAGRRDRGGRLALRRSPGRRITTYCCGCWTATSGRACRRSWSSSRHRRRRWAGRRWSRRSSRRWARSPLVTGGRSAARIMGGSICRWTACCCTGWEWWKRRSRKAIIARALSAAVVAGGAGEWRAMREAARLGLRQDGLPKQVKVAILTDYGCAASRTGGR